jgi:hypothetical protein
VRRHLCHPRLHLLLLLLLYCQQWRLLVHLLLLLLLGRSTSLPQKRLCQAVLLLLLLLIWPHRHQAPHEARGGPAAAAFQQGLHGLQGLQPAGDCLCRLLAFLTAAIVCELLFMHPD